jgi:polar amino acid transport system permease protein
VRERDIFPWSLQEGANLETTGLPQDRSVRNTRGDKERELLSNLDWTVIVDYRHLLFEGFKMTLQISLVSMVLSLLMGIVVGLGKISKILPIRYFFAFYVEFFRNIPLIVLLFFWYFGLGLSSMTASIIGLSIFTSAYIAEIVRAGIEAIPKEQKDAATASGLSSIDIVTRIILPQALMITIPPLGIEFLNVIKNSSIAMTIAVQELTFQSQEIDALTFRGFESTTAVTAIYLLMTLTVVGCVNYIEKRMKMDLKVG